MSYCLDANILISIWNTDYPRDVFPTLYQEIENNLQNEIILIQPIFDEIKPGSPIYVWLEEGMRLNKTNMSDAAKDLTLKLRKKYGEKYKRTKGANYNDLQLIAFASSGNHTVVTYEAEQQQPPKKKSNYKIPLICKEENVKCIRFVEMLRQCNIVV